MNLKELFELNEIQLSENQYTLLYSYREYLLEYTMKMNLISKGSAALIDEVHLLDAAVPVSLLPAAETIVDLGSGGGLPGIVLAILLPETSIILSESKEKKIKFLQSCRRHLNLKNVEVFNPSKQKIEAAAGLVVSRAFGSLKDIAAEAVKYLEHAGRIAAYKGRKESVEKEIAELPSDFSAEAVIYPVKTPAEEIQRRLVLIDKQ